MLHHHFPDTGASVHQRARKHTHHNLEPYSANDVPSSHSPACPSGGALLCKPLCVSNKTQSGRTQVNPCSAHLCFTPPRPAYRLFSSAPLWSDTFGQAGAQGAEAGGCGRWNFSSIFTGYRRSLCTFDSYRAFQANGSSSNDSRLRLKFEVCCNSAANSSE